MSQHLSDFGELVACIVVVQVVQYGGGVVLLGVARHQFYIAIEVILQTGDRVPTNICAEDAGLFVASRCSDWGCNP